MQFNIRMQRSSVVFALAILLTILLAHECEGESEVHVYCSLWCCYRSTSMLMTTHLQNQIQLISVFDPLVFVVFMFAIIRFIISLLLF